MRRNCVGGVAGLCLYLLATAAAGNLEERVGEGAPAGQSRLDFSTENAIKREVTFAENQTLHLLLLDNGLSRAETAMVSRALGNVVNLRRLQIGQALTLYLAPLPRPEIGNRLIGLILALDGGSAAVAYRNFDDRFHARRTARAEAVAMLESIILVLSEGAAPGLMSRDLSLGRGENIGELLTDAGAAPGDIHAATRLLGQFVDLRRLPVGQKVTAIFERTHDAGAIRRSLSSVVLTTRAGERHVIGRGADGQWHVESPAGDARPVDEAAVAGRAVSERSPERVSEAAAAASQATARPPVEAGNPDAPVAPPDVREFVFARGDTLSVLLRRAGASATAIDAVAHSLGGIYDLKRIRPGRRLMVEIDSAGDEPRLQALVLEANRGGGFAVAHGPDGRYQARRIDAAEIERTVAAAGPVPHHAPPTSLAARIDGAPRAALAGDGPDRAALPNRGTFIELLVDASFAYRDAHDAFEAVGELYDLRDLRAGTVVEYERAAATSDPTSGIGRVRLDVNPSTRLEIVRLEDGALVAGLVEKERYRAHVRVEAVIDSSLYAAAESAGMPAKVIMSLNRILGFGVDLQREVRTGDRFSAIFETFFDEDGNRLETGDVLYTSLILSGVPLTLYRHRLPGGRVDYFDRDGQSTRKALMRTPIDGARLTSGFGARRHPILGYTRMHKGLDFGAPTGTPIYAAGDGIVERASRFGNYGRYVRIRHNGLYKTAYAHLSAYADGLHQGKRVRQGEIIGYVGSSGRSTGPHLHYEVIYNGRQVNPNAIDLPAGEPLGGSELAAFARNRDKLDRLSRELPAGSPIMADAPATPFPAEPIPAYP